MIDWIFELSFVEVCLHKKDIFIYTSCFCLFLYLKTFFHSWCSYKGRCFRVFQILLKITPTAHLHPQCVGTKKTCNMSAIDKAHFGRDVGAGFLNPKNLKIERFHILKNSWKWLIEFLNFPSLKSVCTKKEILIYTSCFCLSLHV